MLLASPDRADRLIAAVPLHRETEIIARKIAGKCREVGIEIALVSGTGNIQLCAEQAMD